MDICMAELIKESIFIGTNKASKKMVPEFMIWRGRTYQFTSVGLHHTTYDGDILIHLFSMSSSSACFRISFNSKTLLWTLEAIETV